MAAMILLCGAADLGPDFALFHARVEAQELARFETDTGARRFSWGFGRVDDPQFRGEPDGWRRHHGRGYPRYVKIGIAPKDPQLASQVARLDAGVTRLWNSLNQSGLQFPMPPSLGDLFVDRYLQIVLDGGQALYESPRVPANRVFQYRFGCRVQTTGLRHDSARAELVFMNDRGDVIATHSTRPVTGTTNWSEVAIGPVRPPAQARSMVARLRVDRGADGLEDIRGSVGFDDVQIWQHPQLRITTNEPRGIHSLGSDIEAHAKIMGLPTTSPSVEFRLFNQHGEEVATEVMDARLEETKVTVNESENEIGDAEIGDAEVLWRIPKLEAGFYRLTAAIVGPQKASLGTETTFAVVDEMISGSPHGSFGWTLPNGSDGMTPRELSAWLSKLGVAWVKYPCWLAPDDSEGAELTAMVFRKLQDEGIQTVGLLDHPPADQLARYALRGPTELNAEQLFRDTQTWQPLLEPVMTRFTLKVRKWQLGGDRDHSFLGRPRLRDSIREIAAGLQGFGQPIDVAISWPWLEPQLPVSDTSWQAISRSSDPPLSAGELDSYLELSDDESRRQGPQTWLLLDPISKSQYRREDRVRDLILRMATTRGHRVQAAFVSNPRDSDRGLLRSDGRPDEMLLPWRTTSRLIGDLRHHGSLQMRSGSQNRVFVGSDRAVLMVWSATPTEELMYLGEDVRRVDAWGRVTTLASEVQGNQVVQRIPIGPTPCFIVGVDPDLLAFRMSIALNANDLDSYLGQQQQLAVSFANPTQESLVGRLVIRPPSTWSIDSPVHDWELLGKQRAEHQFQVVLGNTSRIGDYELPIQFQIETVPPRVMTVYKRVTIGPKGLHLHITTRMLDSGVLRVQIEMTNRTERQQSYDCMLFPEANRQHQTTFLTIAPGQTARKDVLWVRGAELVGKRMLLRADEQNGPRVFNHSFEVSR